jgi:hypothetical protein
MHMKMSSMVLTLLCYLYNYHYGLLFFLSTCLHIVIIHSTICAILVNLPYMLLCIFGGATYLVFCDTESAFLTSTVVIISSHNIPTSLCCYNVDCFILVVTILRYDYNSTLNIIVKKQFVVGTCKHEPTSKSSQSKPPPS